MKIRIGIAVFALLLCSSCIVKSLKPFYTDATIHYDPSLLGTYVDKGKGKWEIISFSEVLTVELEKEDPASIDPKALKSLEHFNKAYQVTYVKDDKEAAFIATPFLLEGQLFMDFMLFDYDDKATNALARYHLVESHSLAKIDKHADGSFDIFWLDEDRLQALFDSNSIRIKHEKLGLFNENFVLTASSEELQGFILKYMRSDNPDKWKTDVDYTLKKTDAKP